MSGVDREDGGARKRREAEGEGGISRAGGKREGASRPGARARRWRRREGGARAEAPAGEGRGERRQAVSSGKQSRLEFVDLAGLALRAEREPRRRVEHLQVSRSRATLNACGRRCFTTSVGGAKAANGEAPADPPLPRRQRNVRKSPRWCEMSRRSVRFFRHLGKSGRSLQCQKNP